MGRRSINLALLVAALVGGVQALRFGAEHQQLRAEYRQLVLEVGELRIGDPSRIHVLALPTQEPLIFGWRVYYPPGARVVWQTSLGGSSGTATGWSTDSNEFLARVRLRQSGDGQLQVWASHGTGSSLMGSSDPLWHDLLENPSRAEIEQLGRGSTAVIDPDTPATLLRVSLPGGAEDGLQRPMLEVRLGTADAFERKEDGVAR